MKSVIIAGAAPNTGNLGVSALCRSAAQGLKDVDEDINVTVLGYGDNYEKGTYKLRNKAPCGFMGVSNGKKYYKTNHYRNIDLACKFGGAWNKRAKEFLGCSALLDISAGDSFTDLYGKRRFDGVFFPKKIAKSNGIPLILMPQTLGPFKKGDSIEKVKAILDYCSLAYFRDQRSYEYAKQLMGNKFDPARIKVGVDMAFLLSPGTSEIEVKPNSVGINVSGLVYNNSVMNNSFGIMIDYPEMLRLLIQRLCDESNATIYLVPHVISEYSNECDYKASLALRDSLDEKYRERVVINELSSEYDEQMAKEIISQLDWFCGMRMHATIAALSTCVPVVNIAYSDKAYGVFETAGQEKMVLDARKLSTVDMVNQLVSSWERRSEIRSELESRIPQVKEMAQEQMRDVCIHI